MLIQDCGVRLDAVLERPEGTEGKCPLVIVIHGFTGYKEERHILAVADALRQEGCATLRVDMFGHGHSDGTFHDHNLYRWLNNALAVFDYAMGLDFVSSVYLCGHSQGGMTAMLAAAMERDRVAGLIPLSPAWMIPEGARKGELLGKTFDPERIPDELVSWDGRTLSGNYVRVAQTIRVEDAIAAYKGPVLLVHGDEDEAVPVAYARRAHELYSCSELVEIPGDTHCYDHHLDQVVAAVRDWMRRQLA